ncbi:MAG: Gfo/Idh/MocA family oxidoreductase [Christensenellales bacterium]
MICEKPIALHLKDAQEMFDAAQANGVQLYVAQVLQFTREVEWLHRIVDERLYGEPLDACFERLSQRPAWSQGNWLFDRKRAAFCRLTCMCTIWM